MFFIVLSFFVLFCLVFWDGLHQLGVPFGGLPNPSITTTGGLVGAPCLGKLPC